MDDLELLMMAAKAIGRKVKRIDGDLRTLYGLFFEDHDSDDYSWNPLTDDGDALRLAVKFGMDLTLPSRREEVSAASLWHEGALIHKMIWLDCDAAEIDFFKSARRNITEVAAEIGKGMLNG